MTPERWAKLQRVFHEVVETPAPERGTVLAKACGSDLELQREVEEMLALDTDGEDLLRNAIGGAVSEVVQGQHDKLIGAVIGPYKIKGVLGVGGMGTVYDAERADTHFKQRVAIKLVQQMAVHPQLRSRLRAERQILASLDHPFIARLLDGGETPDGIPYLVIEFVDGKTIDKYCDENKLGVRERIELFEKVCAAVDYAHRNLVVHRDIKPANILVTEDGTPKLLDFGIAKLLNPDPAWNTVAVTRVQDRLLTPEHASPEQVLGRTITIASDVYSLGVLLYELLCGRSPYANQNSTPMALERAICNEDPPLPSTQFRAVRAGAPAQADGFDPVETAARRGLNIERMRRQLAGDVDEIVLKAMRKEPEQRYATAAQLIDDLRRYRIGDAVLARQGGKRYRAIKFVRRNALATGLVSTVIVALASFATMMYIQTGRIARERDLKDREKVTAEEVSAFLVDIFTAADPYNTEGQDVSVTQLLDAAAIRIEEKLRDQPEVKARMLESIGYAYLSRNSVDRAEPLLRKALKLRLADPKTAPTKLATSYKNLADAERLSGNTAAAAADYAKALELYRQQDGGSRDVRIAEVMFGQARLHLQNSELPEAETMLQGALAIYRSAYGDHNKDVAKTLTVLGEVALWRSNFSAAERYQREALGIYQTEFPPKHPDYAAALGALGVTLMKRGSLEEADRLISESAGLQREVFGPDSPKTAVVEAALGELREKQGRFPEAIERLKEALVIADRAKMAPIWKGYYLDSLAHNYLKIGQLEKAETATRTTLRLYAQTLPADHLYFASSLELLGEILMARGDNLGAEASLREAIAIAERAGQDNRWRVARAQSTLGAALARMRRHQEAEVLLLNAYRSLRAARGESDEWTQLARKRVIDFLGEHHRESEAVRLLATN